MDTLNFTEEELNVQGTREVDKLLCEIDQTRRHALLEELPNPFGRALTKEDGLRMFRVIGSPTTGSMLGVYRWAADPGTP